MTKELSNRSKEELTVGRTHSWQDLLSYHSRNDPTTIVQKRTEERTTMKRFDDALSEEQEGTSIQRTIVL